MMTSKRILSIGQCGVDDSGIRYFVRANFAGVEVDPAASEAEALAAFAKRSYDLVLVNRILDRDRSSGIDLIRRLKSDERFAAVPMMLVSNHADAHIQARAVGALEGFGKSELDDTAAAKIKAALGDPA